MYQQLNTLRDDLISLQDDFIVVELYTEWLIIKLNSLQDIVECLNRVIYF